MAARVSPHSGSLNGKHCHEMPCAAASRFMRTAPGKASAYSATHEDPPVTVGLVVDHRGSMKQKLPEVIAAAQTFVRSRNPEEQMFVVNFNEKVSLGLPVATPFSNRTDELQAAIGKIAAAGETALYDTVSVALDRLKSGDREKKVQIVMSERPKQGILWERAPNDAPLDAESPVRRRNPDVGLRVCTSRAVGGYYARHHRPYSSPRSRPC